MVAQEYNLTETKSSANGTDDREAHPKFWIAAYTRSHSEKKAALELNKSKYKHTSLAKKQLRTWSDRKKLVDIPVIPMTIFADVSEEYIIRIRKKTL